MDETEYLFVYGTLRKCRNHRLHSVLVQHADFIGTGTLRGRLYRVGEYPGAVPSTSVSDIIQGELYALRDRDCAFRVLDEYEGCGPDDPQPTEFRRERAAIFLENGQEVSAWVYWYNRPTNGLEAIQSGDFTPND
ncbi:MAG: gamma-glutamylcyclotransferase family protein [bacterium]